MTLNALRTFARMKEYLAETPPVTFSVFSPKDECYQWIQRLCLKYATLLAPERPRPPLSLKMREYFPAAAYATDHQYEAAAVGASLHEPGISFLPTARNMARGGALLRMLLIDFTKSPASLEIVEDEVFLPVYRIHSYPRIVGWCEIVRVAQ